ncbi:MAG: hypothetical protein QM778_17650 [Myxococcales bacterium]
MNVRWCLSALGLVCVYAAVGCGDDPASPNLSSDAGRSHGDGDGDGDGDRNPDESDAGANACCTARKAPGCPDPDVEECVCNDVADCCQSNWDVVCIQLADSLGCTSCKGECCAGSSTPGCNDAKVEQCVCEKAPECCKSEWDEFCSTLVEGLSCGSCE